MSALRLRVLTIVRSEFTDLMLFIQCDDGGNVSCSGSLFIMVVVSHEKPEKIREKNVANETAPSCHTIVITIVKRLIQMVRL